MEKESDVNSAPLKKFIFYNIACYPSLPARYECEFPDTVTIAEFRDFVIQKTRYKEDMFVLRLGHPTNDLELPSHLEPSNCTLDVKSTAQGLRASHLVHIHRAKAYQNAHCDVFSLDEPLNFPSFQSYFEAAKNVHPIAMPTTFPKSSIYTMRGDFGESSLYNGERRSKRDRVFGCLGTVDELNSRIGFAFELFADKTNANVVVFRNFLEVAQCRMLDSGSHIATPRNKSSQKKIDRTDFPVDALPILDEHVNHLEAAIAAKSKSDERDKALTPSTEVKYPTLHNMDVSCVLAVCGCVSSRVEMLIKPLVEKKDIDEILLQFFQKLTVFFNRSVAFFRNDCEFIFTETLLKLLESKEIRSKGEDFI